MSTITEERLTVFSDYVCPFCYLGKAAIVVVYQAGVREEAFKAFHERTFEALWQEGQDIGDPDILVDIADDVDVPEDVVNDAVDDDQLEAEVKQRFEEAKQRA